MTRTLAFLAIAASLAGAAVLPSPAAAAVTYICTTSADCDACKKMHPESTCQTAISARNPRDTVLKFVAPKPVLSSPTPTALKPIPKPTTLPDGSPVSYPK